MKTITIEELIEHLNSMKPDVEFVEFDNSKSKDTIYCVEWGMMEQKWIEQGIYDRYISELTEQLKTN